MQDDCRTGQMHYRTDAGQEGQVSGRRGQMQYRMDAGQVKYITGRMMETFISFYSWKIFLLLLEPRSVMYCTYTVLMKTIIYIFNTILHEDTRLCVMIIPLNFCLTLFFLSWYYLKKIYVCFTTNKMNLTETKYAFAKCDCREL